jgi:hypothetical protein
VRVLCQKLTVFIHLMKCLARSRTGQAPGTGRTHSDREVVGDITATISRLGPLRIEDTKQPVDRVHFQAARPPLPPLALNKDVADIGGRCPTADALFRAWHLARLEHGLDREFGRDRRLPGRHAQGAKVGNLNRSPAAAGQPAARLAATDLMGPPAAANHGVVCCHGPPSIPHRAERQPQVARVSH